MKSGMRFNGTELQNAIVNQPIIIEVSICNICRVVNIVHNKTTVTKLNKI